MKKFAIPRTPRPETLPVYLRHLAGVSIIEIASGARKTLVAGSLTGGIRDKAILARKVVGLSPTLPPFNLGAVT